MLTLRNLAVLALVLSVSLAQDQTTCKSFTCAKIKANSEPPKEGQELKYTCSSSKIGSSGIALDFEVCPPGNFECDINSASIENGMCSAIKADRLPGDVCQIKEQCISNVCTNGVCVGKNKGESCNDLSEFCNPRLYCGPTNVCEPVLLLGEDCNGKAKGCEFFTRCMNNGGIQKCTQLFSQEQNFDVGAGNQFLCKHAYINGSSQCDYGPYLDSANNSRETTSIENCNYKFYKDTSKTMVAKSTCGFNASTSAYCPFMAGDMDHMNENHDLINFGADATRYECSNYYEYQQNVKFGFRCAALQTAVKNSGEHEQSKRTALEVIFYLLDEKNYGLVANNDKCVMNSTIPQVQLYHEFIKGDGMHEYVKKEDFGMYLSLGSSLAVILAYFF